MLSTHAPPFPCKDRSPSSPAAPAGSAARSRAGSRAAAPRSALWDIDLAKAQAVAAELPEARAYAVDVTDYASVEAATAAVARDFGRIDILVNSAGANGPSPRWSTTRSTAGAGPSRSISTACSTAAAP